MKVAYSFLCLLLAAGPATAQEKVFFGNLHSHTSYSDGSGTPAEAYKHARDIAKVDFLAITEHNHAAAEQGASPDRRDGILIAKDHNLYSGASAKSVISAARAATVDGKFVAIYGQEFSTIGSGNHVNVFEVPNVITVPSGAFDQLVILLASTQDSRGKRPLLQFNHPGMNKKNPAKDYGEDDFDSQAEWVSKVGTYAHTIAILNGPHDSKEVNLPPPDRLFGQYLRYLNLGFHLAPVADQDNHYRTWGDGTVARTAVIASALTKAQILDAIEARHVYATEDPDLRLIFKVNGHLLGDRIPAPAVGAALDITYSIQDPSEPDAEYSIEIFSGTIGGGPAAVADKVDENGNTTSGKIDSIRYEGGNQYIFLRVTQFDDEGGSNVAWTAPVWLEPSGGSTGTPAVTTNVTSAEEFVASKNRPIYHLASCRDAANIAPQNRLTGAKARQGRTLHEGCPRK